MYRYAVHTFPNTKEKQGYLKILGKLEHSRSSRIEPNNNLNFVKIISLKNGNFDLALRKRLFCNAKPTLLPCKTAAFGTQNNRFCNTLVINRLDNTCVCEKYLHFYRLLFVRLVIYQILYRYFCTSIEWSAFLFWRK